MKILLFFMATILGLTLFFALKEKKYGVKLNAHAFGAWQGKTYTNSKEAFENSYKNGFRIFETDISETSDQKFVAKHLWNESDYINLEMDFNPENPVLSEKEFLSRRLLAKTTSGATPLSLNGVFELMKKYPDATVMFDFLPGMFDKNNPALMERFASFFTDPDIARRSIIEVYSVQNALALKKAGFENIQLWIDYPSLRPEEMARIEDYISFLTQNNIKIISISAQNAMEFPEETTKLKAAGITIFSPGWNSYKNLKMAEKLNIDVVTTDFLMPSTPLKLRLQRLRYRLLSHITTGKMKQHYKFKKDSILP